MAWDKIIEVFLSREALVSGVLIVLANFLVLWFNKRENKG